MNEVQQQVVVVDVRMRFWSMVVFMVKLAIASIPAVLILYLLAMAPVLLWTGLMRWV